MIRDCSPSNALITQVNTLDEIRGNIITQNPFQILDKGNQSQTQISDSVQDEGNQIPTIMGPTALVQEEGHQITNITGIKISEGEKAYSDSVTKGEESLEGNVQSIPHSESAKEIQSLRGRYATYVESYEAKLKI